MHGIEVYDSNGVVKFSSSNRLARVLATFNTTGTSGTRSVPGMDTGEVFAVSSMAQVSDTQFNTFPATVTINRAAGTVSWSISYLQVASTITICVF